MLPLRVTLLVLALILYGCSRRQDSPSLAALYMSCNAGDSKACDQMYETGEHQAMVSEQLKSPEARQNDRERSHGFLDVPPQ